MNENGWEIYNPGLSNPVKSVDIGDFLKKKNMSFSTVQKVEHELSRLTEKEFQILLGYDEGYDEEMFVDLDTQINEVKCPTANKFFNQYYCYE